MPEYIKGSEKISANMIVGAKKEPFLYSSLRSIVNAVDEIVVVANENNENKTLLDVFPKVRVAYHPFKDFSTARNNCMAMSKDADFIFWVDADEVHFPQELKSFMKNSIERGHDGAVAAFYHFIKDKKHYQSIDARMILFRNKPGIYWDRKVDEIVEGFLPADIARTDYEYHHYGYTRPQREIWEAWMQREKILGTKEWYHDKDPETILDERKVKIYTGAYPNLEKEKAEILCQA